MLVSTYVLVTIAAQAYAGTGEGGLGLSNEENAEDVFSALGNAVLGSGWGKALIFMVLTSAAASTLTTILPTARTTLSMAVFKAIPDRFAQVHPRHLTPTWSTIGMGVVSVVFYVGLSAVSDSILQDSILSIGLAIAFYYGLTGFACAWWYRTRLFDSPRTFIARGLLPLLGGVLLLGAFVKSAWDMVDPDYGYTSLAGVGGVFVLGIGSLLLGVVLMVIWNVVAPDYFRGRTLNADTTVTVAEDGTVDRGRLGLPDAPGRQRRVVPEDDPDDAGPKTRR